MLFWLFYIIFFIFKDFVDYIKFVGEFIIVVVKSFWVESNRSLVYIDKVFWWVVIVFYGKMICYIFVGIGFLMIYIWVIL